MRTFNNEEAVSLSGLTRGQIDQLISRYGLGIYGTPGHFKARRFNGTDMFNLMVAGKLHELGVAMPAIRDVLLVAFGLYAWDTATNQPAEFYPGQNRAGAGRQVLGVFRWDDQWHAQLREADKSGRFGPAGTVSFVIDATGIVEMIEAAAAKASVL